TESTTSLAMSLVMRLRPPALDAARASQAGPGLRICAWPPSVPRLRVERVAQRVTEEVDRQDRQEQHQAGKEDQIELRRRARVRLRVRQHPAPRILGRLHTEAEVRQRGLGA